MRGGCIGNSVEQVTIVRGRFEVRAAAVRVGVALAAGRDIHLASCRLGYLSW